MGRDGVGRDCVQTTKLELLETRNMKYDISGYTKDTKSLVTRQITFIHPTNGILMSQKCQLMCERWEERQE